MKNRLKRLVKRQLGWGLSRLRPDIVRKIESRLETERMPGSADSLIERLVLEAEIARHMAAHEEEVLVRSHKAFWSGDRALVFHGAANDRLERNFFGKHKELLENLQYFLGQGRYERLCEIGCGSGFLTNALMERFPMLTEVVGIDLCAKQAEMNRARYSNPRLHFVAADATAWVPEHARSATIYLTYDGVLEYFTQHELEGMLRSIAGHEPVCFALMEPIAFDYDLETEIQSRLFDSDMSLSHNYPRIFREAGFRVHWQKDLPRERYLMMVAFKDSSFDAADSNACHKPRSR